MPVFLLFTYYNVFKSTYFSHIIVRVFRRYMAEILPIRNKTLFNQSINVRVYFVMNGSILIKLC